MVAFLQFDLKFTVKKKYIYIYILTEMLLCLILFNLYKKIHNEVNSNIKKLHGVVKTQNTIVALNPNVHKW